MSAYIPALASSPRQALTVKEYCNWTAMQALRADWNRLLHSHPYLGIFATPEWLASWWEAYGEGKEPLILTFADEDNEIVGLCPFYLERSRSFLPGGIKVLRLVGDGSQDSDDLDFIVRPGYEKAVTQAFLQWAKNQPWQNCELNCLSPRSEVAKLLQRELERAGWRHVIHLRPLVTVNLPETWEQYLKQLSSKERGKVGNRFRRLENRRQLRFHKCETDEQLPDCLQTLFSLHRKRWEALGQPGVFNRPERRRFYQKMTRRLLSRNRLELWFMELDGQPVAAQIALRYGCTVYSLQEGFDPAFASDSVGYVLRSYVLRQSIAAGIRKYEFLYGDQDSKQRWGAATGSYTDIHFARPGSWGVPHLLGAERVRVAKDWFRRHLPAPVWKRLQSFKAFWKGAGSASSSEEPTGRDKKEPIVELPLDPDCIQQEKAKNRERERECA